jgi:hypothetical protein
MLAGRRLTFSVEIALFISCFDCVALVVHFFTSGQGDCDFDFSAFKINFERNDCESFLFKFAFEIFDFAFVHQEFACFSAFVLESGAEFVWFDIQAVEEYLTVFDLAVSVGEIGTTEVEALYFGAN